MKVYNETFTTELNNVDLNKGYLEEAIINNKVVYVYKLYTDKQLLNNELYSLKNWFNTEYTKQEQKLRRLHTLGDSTAYDKLIELYQKAETIRARIQDIEVQIEK